MPQRFVCLLLALTLAPAARVDAATHTLAVSVTEQRPGTLSGEFLATRGAGPYPTVMLLHGCGGLSRVRQLLHAHLKP